MASHPHLLWLDAIRGVAALSVFGHHMLSFIFMNSRAHAWGVFGSGYLAVDLFFLLSGFVIALSYESQLRQGLPWQAFARSRLIRLYPLYILGLTAGLAFFLIKAALTDGNMDPAWPMSYFFNAAFLPNPAAFWNFQQMLFPSDPVAWSLSYEIAINLAFAASVPLLTTRRLTFFILLSFMCLAHEASIHGDVGLGPQATTTVGGVARICFSFGVGILLLRSSCSFRLPQSACLALMLTLFLLILPRPIGTPYFDLFCVAIIFPLILSISVHAPEPRGAIAATSAALGRISYALYILHSPCMSWFSALWKAVSGTDIKDYAISGALFLALATIATSWIATQFFDEPIRSRLRQQGLRKHEVVDA